MKRTVFPILVLSIIAGCGGSSSGGSAPSTRIVLPAVGGTITAKGITFVVPPGAVPSDATVSISSASGLPEKSRVVGGTAFAFSPTTFGKPVRLTYALSAAALEDEPAVYKLVDGIWLPMPTTINDSANTVSALVESFSTYAVLRPPSDVPPVKAEAGFAEDGQTPAVKLAWTPNGFFTGSGSIRQWQIYRDDQSPHPVHVLDGAQRSLLEPVGVTGPDYAKYTSYPDAGSTAQRHTEFNNVDAPATIPVLEVGVPHAYGVQALYSILGIDLPNAPGGLYYFLTGIESTGRATPLNRPLVVTANGATASDGSTFAFQSALPGDGVTPIQYVVEASTSLNFSGRVHIGTVTSAAGGEISVPLVGLNAAFPAGTTVYVRVGARNARDLPGPVVNGATRERFVFSGNSTLVTGS